MAVAVIVSFVSMVMSMAVVSVSKCCETHNVDEEAQDTDNQKLIETPKLVTFPKALKSVEDDLNTDEKEKYTVGESGQRIDLSVAIRKACIWPPLAHDRSRQADGETSTVEQHVDTVGEKTQ